MFSPCLRSLSVFEPKTLQKLSSKAMYKDTYETRMIHVFPEDISGLLLKN